MVGDRPTNKKRVCLWRVWECNLLSRGISIIIGSISQSKKWGWLACRVWECTLLCRRTNWVCPAKKKKVGYWVCRVWECKLLCRRHLNNNWEYIPILKIMGLAIGYVAYECVTCSVGDISRIGCARWKKKGLAVGYVAYESVTCFITGDISIIIGSISQF